jgi:hypothetical protein
MLGVTRSPGAFAGSTEEVLGALVGPLEVPWAEPWLWVRTGARLLSSAEVIDRAVEDIGGERRYAHPAIRRPHVRQYL